MSQQWVAAYSEIQSAQSMASYLRNIVDERDIHLITGADSQLFVSMRGRLRSTDSEFNYEDILRDGGALLVVDAEDEEIAQIEALLSRSQTITAREQDCDASMDEDTRESVAVASNRGQVQERFGQVEEELQSGKREIESERGDLSNTRDYHQHMDRYREDYSTRYSSTGHPFDHYSPAYELGHRLATDPQYRDSTWEELEPAARSYWERNHSWQHGAWEQFREAAQHAWQLERGTR